MTLIFVDVEAAGLTPMTGTMTEFGAVDYTTRQYFHGKIFESTPDPETPAIPVVGQRIRPLGEVMSDFDQWIKMVSGSSRPIFVSDNPAYDFMWIATAFDVSLGRNPFGHSARRIGDFYAGLKRDFYTRQDWKRLRKTPHDHHPVNDAMGNLEAMDVMMGWVGD